MEIEFLSFLHRLAYAAAVLPSMLLWGVANALIQPGVTAAGAEWLDVYPALADATGQLDPRYSSDGLHLSPAGYRAWAARLRPYLP